MSILTFNSNQVKWIHIHYLWGPKQKHLKAYVCIGYRFF